jgi:DNA-binding NarL/FixJ family response regulator
MDGGDSSISSLRGHDLPQRPFHDIMKFITVLLADDHEVVREGFRSLLRMEKDISVIGEAQTGRKAVELAKELRPNVVVMDIAMPLLNGMEAARQILAALPATNVLILSAYSSDDYLDRVVRAGITGYLLKQSSASLLATAIRELAQGKPFFDPVIAKRVFGRPTAANKNAPMPAKIKKSLSAREEEILQLIAEGTSNKQIASVLNLSIKTVEKHRQRLMDKLRIHNTAGLTRYALTQGVIEDGVQIMEG